MNFNHLEYAIAVSKYGSISKTAEKLYMSQPYLSGMLKSLEEELGYRIFDRKKSGVELTPQGEQFIKSAQLILLELKRIREINDVKEKALNISCYYTSYVMKRFLKFKNTSKLKLPDKIKEMGNREVMESVMSGESTLGIVFYASDKQDKYKQMAVEMGLKMRELFKPMPMYAILSGKHPLAGKESICTSDLVRFPYVSYDDASSQLFLKFLGIEHHKDLLEVSDRGSFYDALISGGYLSVMAYREIPANKDLVLIPITDRELLLSSSYVAGCNYKLTKREQEFLKFIRQEPCPVD